MLALCVRSFVFLTNKKANLNTYRTSVNLFSLGVEIPFLHTQGGESALFSLKWGNFIPHTFNKFIENTLGWFVVRS